MSVDTLERRDDAVRLAGLQFDIVVQEIEERVSKGVKATQDANTKMLNAMRDDFRDYRAEFTTFRGHVDGRLDSMSADLKEILRRIPPRG
jgi:hypothetical protein